MVQLRWPDGDVRCPTCGSNGTSFISTRRVWTCRENHERKQFSIKVGTIFEDSPITLDKWMAAMWLIANDGVLGGAMVRARRGKACAAERRVMRQYRGGLPTKHAVVEDRIGERAGQGDLTFAPHGGS